MGKQGPCCHCGVTSTPLWRNGPADKPVLCNACGSRWRTKGSLANYAPLHARGVSPIDTENHKSPRVDKSPCRSRPPQFSMRTNQDDRHAERIERLQGYDPGPKGLEDDTSNRSSSGSGISYSESCVQFGSTDVNDVTGSAQSHVWDSHVPSKKRTCITRQYLSPVEKLRKDLCEILHEQDSSQLSGYSEDDVLLFDSETPMDSVEIGLGSVLIKHPLSTSGEEESEASSLVAESRCCIVNEAYSGSSLFPAPTLNRERGSIQVDDNAVKFREGEMDRIFHEKMHTLANEPLESLHSNNFDTLGRNDSASRYIDPNVKKNNEFAEGKGVPSCSSGLVAGGVSTAVKRPLDWEVCKSIEGAIEKPKSSLKRPYSCDDLSGHPTKFQRIHSGANKSVRSGEFSDQKELLQNDGFLSEPCSKAPS
ncbi:GATA transcription factor 26 isoform X1 [Amborella trichopoda]|uniref:GATA transcription factor 26 isoform X1 n=1 Tax=Amborella trichopoda TaxID=13333 RepID=UPI0005D3BEB9|nr:GATA transcription factor 26 isoform X1 [Amborella trichopoda]|eukprot:XP_011626314.1 GATA transcription factor 26 isoform X1 [Amborella trichopoda]